MGGKERVFLPGLTEVAYVEIPNNKRTIIKKKNQRDESYLINTYTDTFQFYPHKYNFNTYQ